MGNPPRKKSRLTEAQIIEALELSMGNVTSAAARLGYTSRWIYKRAESSVKIQETIRHYREVLVDKAEEALSTAIGKGEITAIIFTLKTLGKSRGYVERSEHELRGNVQQEVLIRFVDDWNGTPAPDSVAAPEALPVAGAD